VTRHNQKVNWHIYKVNWHNHKLQETGYE